MVGLSWLGLEEQKSRSNTLLNDKAQSKTAPRLIQHSRKPVFMYDGGEQKKRQ